jgi:hypothetical protein
MKRSREKEEKKDRRKDVTVVIKTRGSSASYRYTPCWRLISGEYQFLGGSLDEKVLTLHPDYTMEDTENEKLYEGPYAAVELDSPELSPVLREMPQHPASPELRLEIENCLLQHLPEELIRHVLIGYCTEFTHSQVVFV